MALSRCPSMLQRLGGLTHEPLERRSRFWHLFPYREHSRSWSSTSQIAGLPGIMRRPIVDGRGRGGGRGGVRQTLFMAARVAESRHFCGCSGAPPCVISLPKTSTHRLYFCWPWSPPWFSPDVSSNHEAVIATMVLDTLFRSVPWPTRSRSPRACTEVSMSVHAWTSQLAMAPGVGRSIPCFLVD
jgi:hypothetical protein